VRRLLVVAAAGSTLSCLLAAAAPPAGDAHGVYRFRLLFRAGPVTHLATPPGTKDRLYVVQQNGVIRLAVDGRLRRQPFLDLGRRVSVGGEQGLLAMAFHPRYARNRRFYVHYSGIPNVTRVVEYRANRAGTAVVPRSARSIYSLPQPGADHKGGQLAFGPDGKLYLGLGDGECCDDPQGRAQDLSQPFGKLVRFDVSRARPTPEIVGLGLRNPWRFSFDRATGDLYLADVGAGRFEEVDYVPRAGLNELLNYGWDVWEARSSKEDKPHNPAGRLLFPIFAYPHEGQPGCTGSITGGFVYRGSAAAAARGRYFFGDYCSGAMWTLRVEGGEARDVRREPWRIPELSTFGEGARGELYAASHGGRVYRLVP
jgi:glucose/arabinose dehydrogenase